MRQFIPFEDEWDVLDAICMEALTPYRVGLVVAHSAGPASPSICSVPPARTPIRVAVPTESTGST